ncbi:filamin-C isoform X1 [Sergentomyia squamirostris]
MEKFDLKNVKVTHKGVLQHNADGTTELQKITQAGLVARSPEGTAAKGMNIRGNEDLWVEIQANTFKNWVNEHLRDTGMRVTDWGTDFTDGTHLCALVESLQQRPLKPSWNHRPANQHHFLENVTCALSAIEKDGVKLVNIGNVDIVNGNLKLILGLIWSLIVRYQIGRSKFPPRKLMLAWLQAALPECKITNLTTDWNSGIFLSALLDYCEPGLFPHWRSLDSSQAIRNCTNAMDIAQREFGIPKVLEPEYLASPWLDELSGMTYLSYFMKPGGPGYNATMRWVNTQVKRPVANFTTDWNDGRVFCEIIKGLGGPAPDPEKLRHDPSYWETNIKKAVDAGEKLGVRPVLSPKDMANPEVEHLGIMAYAAHLQWVPPRPPLSNLIAVHLESTSGRVGDPTHFRVELLTRDIELSSVRCFVEPPHEKAPQLVRLNSRGQGTFVPDRHGMHEIVVEVDDSKLGGHFFRVLPRYLQVAPPGMAPCALGSLVEVLVNATGAPKSEDILVTAYSPTARPLRCPLKKVDEGHSAIFKPDEAGIWEIAITYQGRHIQGGPFTCAVFDPSGVSVHGLDGALPNRAHSFEVDARGVGVSGELYVDIVHEKHSLVCSVEKLVENKYRVTFMPRQNGKYRVYVYFNGYDVKGSPYIMRVGTKGRSGKTRSSSHTNRSESPQVHYTSTSSATRRSYSPQFSSRERELYSPKSPSPGKTFGNEVYSSSYKTESRKHVERSSPSHEYYLNSDYRKTPSRDDVDPYTASYTSKLFSENNKSRRDTYSPVSSPITVRGSSAVRSSPVTVTTTTRYESTTRNVTSSPKLTSSPRLTSISPPPLRQSASPSFTTTTINRISSPGPSGLDSSRLVKQQSSSYKSSYVSSNENVRSSPLLSPTRNSPNTFGIDHSSNIRVSGAKNGAARRDSWDAINKTKHILSPNSLESLANMTENQLNTDITHNKSRDIDHETERNTQYNKFALHEGRFSSSPTVVQPTSHYSTSTVKETSERFVTSESSGYGYSSPSRFLPIDKDVTGARAIFVQNIPNGVLGRPVEFEIDGSRAGSGNLEILVNGGRVTSSVRALGGQRFIASFTPHETGVHKVQITFNGETVPGSPWHVEIMSSPGLTPLGESTRLVPANTPAVFEILPPPGTTLSRGECLANVLSPSKSKVPARITHEAANGAMRIEFVPTEVGTHIIEASIGGNKIVGGPLIAKVYDSSLIQVTDVNGGVVGQKIQFRVDASAAGEGQLEISINEGEVPNHVQVVGGGRCLVSFTPEQAKTHFIDIKFNGETVRGCPFICAVADTSRVLLNLSNLELIALHRPATFHITVTGGGAAELAVSVRGPHGELPVRVVGDINAGFTAEFTPVAVGAHTINVEYNGYPVQGTPFVAKSYDASRVTVGAVTKGTVGRMVQFTVDAGEAGEGNLEITISAKGHNIPTQVHPQGNARFAVSFIPAEACEHIINVSFNKMPVPGCPISVSVSGGTAGPQVSLGGPGPIHQPNSLVINHEGGRLEDIEVNVEGPLGQSVPAQVHLTSDGMFKAEFVPRSVGEHRVSVTVKGQATAGSPYSAKVYDVNAIKVKNVSSGTVGKAVTFLVETSQAGPGNLEVTVNGGRVPTSAQAQGQHTYAISFTPREAQNHTVELRFNGQNVPGSPFNCKISAAARIAPDTVDKVSVGKVFRFNVESDTAPQVEVLGPARRNVPTQVTPVTGGFSVEFEPSDVGDHSVEVKLPQSGHVEGSPFLLKAYSAEKVIVTDIRPGVVGKSVSFGINASQAGAGNLEIIVAVNGKNVPNFVQSEGNARFKVNFKPIEPAPHLLSVRFNGHAVPGSPFSCPITAAPTSPIKAMAKGECLKQAAVKMDNTIQLEGFEGVEPQVLVTSPSGDNVTCRIVVRDHLHLATFRPTAVGRHLISVTVHDQHINGSPYSCNVFDVSRVSISGLEQHSGPATLGAPVTFSVDAAGAGEGTLELVVSTATSTVKAEVVACARGLYDVTFIPQTNEPHFVNITFNDVPVDGSPFHVDVQQNIQHCQVGGVAIIELSADDQLLEITTPDRKHVSYSIVGGTFGEFRTHAIGTYIVNIIDRESRSIVGTRTVNVFDPSLVKIVEVGEAFCHRAATIGVSIYDAGQGTLTAMVRCGALEVPHSIRGPSKLGIWEIVYHPNRVAPHKINIMYNGVPISAKPLEITVLPPGFGKETSVNGIGLYQARVGKTTSFSIDTVGRPAREFDVVVSGPGREALPVRCYQTKGGHLQAEFTTHKVGQCLIEVLHQSKPLPGSPFTCEAYEPSKVTLHSVPRGLIKVHSPITFTLSEMDAGLAELEVFATSPINHNLPVNVLQKRDGNYMIEFTPRMAGPYKVSVLYGGEPVNGTPLTFTVSPAGQSPKADARASGNGLEVAQRGKENSFIVYCPTAPNVLVERSDMQGERIEPKTKSLGNNEWRISYTILSVGMYEIRASCPNKGPLPGSPWTIACIDTNKVIPVGGWGQLLDNEGRLVLPARIIFDTSQAGPGELSCAVDGRELVVDKQSEDKSRIHISSDGLTTGEHIFDLTFNGVPVIQSPQLAYVTSQQLADKVVLTGRGLAAAQANEPAHFTIDATSASPGRPDVSLMYNDNVVVPVTLNQPRPNEPIWLASYTPTRSAQGPLNLIVRWNGRIVKGCPLSVAVGSSVDASKVLCSGEGLRHGVVGREIKSWIDTRRAGPGELTAHCTGPRKVAYCELYDHGDATFTLNVKPQEAGRHLLTIKYGGQHVTGSPFALRVAGAPDASKVRVYGPGIEHGVLATFQSRFICDTRGAGAGQLTVRVRGPKGAFRVEMQRESQKDRTILCKYDPTEPGDYRVEVKWAGELVPGSPFPVMIFDTEEELRRYIQGI